MKHLSLNKTFLGVAISAVIASGAYAETVTEGVDLKQLSKKSALETEGEIVVDVESKNPFSAFSRGEKAQSHLVNSDINNTLNFLKEQGLLETNEQKVSIVTGDNTQVKSDLLIRKVFASANCTLPGGACTTISSSSCTLRGGSVGACGSSPEIDVEESGATTVSEDFGSVAADGVATTTKTFTVKNEGTGNLTTTAVSITSGSSDFSITGGTCATNGQTLSSGMQCTILVTVQTTTVGGISGNLRISNTDANESMYNVSLSATGTSTNSAPVVDLNGTMTPGTGSFSAFSEGSGAVNIAPDASAADSDGDTITTITVALTNDQDGTSEGLNASAAAQNALGGISGASDITLQDTISITGASATVAEVTTFLQAITYNNTSATPNTTSRTVSVVINDGTENSISRTATTSVANLTAASSTAAGFSTLDGTNLNPAITFSSDNETLTISNPSHITGSVADGGTGTDTIHVPTGSDLTAFTTLTGFETLSVPSSVTLTLSEAQHEQFTTISGSGAPVFTITAGSGGDANLTANSTIATYVLNTPVSLTLVDRDQSVTGSNLADSVDISNFSYRGTLDGGDGTDTLTLANGASLAAATISNFETLNLSGGVSVTMKEAQHDAFSTISGAGTDQITISDATNGLIAANDIETYVLGSANTITLSNGSQNITGSTGNDTVNIAGLTVTGTLNANGGTDTLSMATGADTTSATVSSFENLTLATNSSVALSAAQVSTFTGTITASGAETITVSGDGNFTTLSNIETFNVGDDSTNTRTITLGSSSVNVTSASTTDANTFDVSGLTFTGTITGEASVNDTLSISNTGDITGATVSNIENLTLSSGARVSMTRSQHAGFTGTISAIGSETIDVYGDGDFSTFSDVETYNVFDDSSNSRTITIVSATQSIIDRSSNTAMTFALGGAGFSGSLTSELNAADKVSVTDGADVTSGSFFNIGTLSLASAATVAIDVNNINDFNTAITGSAGADTLKLMDGGIFNFSSTTVSGIENLAIGTNNNTTITLTDNFNTDAGVVSFSNASGSAITAAVTLDASAFSADILTMTSSDFNGDDVFKGGSGADTLRPGAGTDTLTGNAGNDNFVGSSSQLSGDTITDLAAGDRITITGITGLSASNVRFNGTSTLEVDTNATDFNISELTLSLTNAPGNDLAFTVADSGSDSVITFVSANSTPTFSSLNGGATFIEGLSAVSIDSDMTIADAELDALNSNAGDYNNASLTIRRRGGASAEDRFGHSGLLGTLIEGNTFSYNGNNVGTVTTNSAGTLTLTFNSNATSVIVDSVAQAITYANNSDIPLNATVLDYTFNDGVVDSTGTNQASVTITSVNDAPTVSAVGANPTFTENGSQVGIFSSASINAIESGQNIEQILLTVSNVKDIGNEFLQFGTDVIRLENNASGTYSGSVNFSYVVTLSGSKATVTIVASDTAAVWQNYVPFLAYKNTSESPTEGDRVVTLTSIKDSGGTSNGGVDRSTGSFGSSTVKVVGVNDDPTDITLSATNINQSLVSLGADVGTLSTTDLDDSTHTYTLVAPSSSASGSCSSNSGNSSFQINGSVLETQAAISAGTYIVCVQADDASSSFKKSFTVTVTDNIAPTGHSVLITQDTITRDNEAALGFTLNGLESSGSFTYKVTDGSNEIIGNSRAITGASAQVTGVNVTTLNEGTLTLSVTVSDTAGNEASDVTATIVKSYNIKPVLSGTPLATIDEDSQYSFTATLTDPDTSDIHTFSITNKPSWATFDTATGLLSGTPTDQDVGTSANVNIKVSDGTEDSAAIIFDIEVKNTNDAPVGQNFAFSLDEGALFAAIPVNGVLSNATDDDLDSGDTFTAVKVTNPSSGTVTLNSDGSFSYQHDGSESTSDSFTYQIEDAAGDKSAVQTVSFTVTPVEDAPIVVADSITTDEDTPVTFSVVSNDSDAEDNMVVSSAAIVDAPTKGQASIANGIVTYTPLSNVSGTDSFTYTVKDSTGLISEKATVSITITPVNDAPIAINFNEMVDEDTPTSALSIRSNATDIEDTIPTGDISVVAQPSKGSVSVDQNDGTLIYTPTGNENGSDTFTYTIADSNGLASNTASVTVNIGAVNDRPVVVNDAVTTDEDTATSVAILANDSDVEDQGFNGANVLLENKGDGAGEYDFASVSVNLDGSLAITPKANINGVHSFTYTVTDSEGLTSLPATVTLSITAINDAPVAVDNTAQLQEEGQFEVNVLGNDSDVDIGDSLNASSVTIVTNPANGSVSVLATGAIVYTPQANFFGDDSFTYTVEDSNAAVSNIATVTMSVAPVNDKPIAVAQSQSLDEDGSILLTLVATDIDQDTLSYRIVNTPSKGTLVQQSNDSWLYTTNENINGTDSFTFVANDGEIDSDEVTVSLIINAINDAPTVAGQVLSTNEDTALTVTLSGNDIEEQSLSYRVVTEPANGSTTLTGNILIYTPNSNFNGSDSVSIVANDGELDSEFARISISVDSVNDAPLISGIPAASVNEDSEYLFIPIASDTDNDTLTFSINNKPSWASFNSETGKLSGTPLNAQVGSYSNIVISVNDATVTQSLAPFNITVINTNDAPTITGTPTAQVNEEESYSFTPSAQDMDGDALTFSISNKPSWASFNSATGQLSGTPVRENAGQFTNIVIAVTDGQLEARLPAFTVTVNNTNKAPVSQSMMLDVLEDASITFAPDVSDLDDDILTLTAISQPQFGTLSKQGNVFTYSPNANYFGIDSFTYIVSDGTEQSAIATVSLNVISVNDRPVANPDVFSLDINEENTYLLDVLANDTDADEQPLSIIGASASVGSVTIENGVIAYKSQASTQGIIQISYLIEDPDKARSRTTAKLTLNKQTDDVPTIETPVDLDINAKGLFTKVDLGVPLATDNQGNRLAVSLVDSTSLFTPGSHLVYWQAFDSNGLEAIATQSINVNPLISLSKDSQVAEDQTYRFNVFLNGESPTYPVTIPYTVSGTANSADHDLTSSELVIESGVQGQVSFTVFADSEIEGNETIIVSLANTLNLGARSTVNITIVEDNVAPTISTSIKQNEEARSLVAIGEELVTITGVAEDINPSDNVTLNWLSQDDQLTNTSTNEGEFVFSTQSLAPGIYKVSVTAEDDGEPNLSTTKEIYVEVVQSLATLDSGDSDGDLIPDDQEGFTDTDNDGIPDYLDAISQCNVVQGQVKDSDKFLVEGEPGVCVRKGVTVVQNVTGGVQLLESELPADANALNIGGVFDFIATGLPNPGDTYSIVFPQRKPISQNSTYRKFKEGQWVDFVSTAQDQILSAAGEPGYCPPPRSSEWTQGLAEGAWCVQLQIVDGGPNDDDGKANGSIVDPGGVAVVRTTNQLPQANQDEVTIGAGESITIDVLENDTDIDGDALTLTGATVDFGQVSIIDNQILYTPPTSFIGIATIEYSITDGQGGTSNNNAKVNLVANNAPTAIFDTASTTDRVSIEIDVLGNDTDIDMDELFIISAAATYGTVSININGTLQYMPKVGFEGVDTVDYTIKDSKGAKSSAQVEITVSAVKSVSISNKSSGGSMGGVGLLLISMLVFSRRKSLFPSFAIITTSCLISGSALAEAWSFEGTVGQAKAKHSLAITGSDVKTISVDDKDTSWSVGAYYELAPNWEVAIRYIDLGQGRVELTADTTTPNDLHNDYARYAPILPKGVATEVGYLFMPAESFSTKLFLGAYRHQYKIQSDITNGATLESKKHTTKLYAGGSVGYSIYKNTELLLKYSYYKVSKNDVSELSAGVKVRF
ncbi:Ig-like domain-containing protein [Pseudoalteromonas sp. 20-92]|uniref:tandem-95 repeat protein n=1 Tax=Pseudoalteromonas sp. 20-92 TaxID=2969394 RepID=UPI0027B0FCAA|nr:Ig-like domain-containing protein [Pseudoalteromonas sp. 20-92]MDQ2042392.1 Ig-like domain-containing protein [Pseudoalteromonas sp. 20-92]